MRQRANNRRGLVLVDQLRELSGANMETDIPITTVTGGNTERWTREQLISLWVPVVTSLSLILTISTIVWKCRQAKKEKNKKKAIMEDAVKGNQSDTEASNQGATGGRGGSDENDGAAKKEENKKKAIMEDAVKGNQSDTEASNQGTRIAAKISETELDQSCPSHQAGGQSSSDPLIPVRKVDMDALFDELSREFPAANYSTFCNKMGVSFNLAKSTLTKYKEDSIVALRDLLAQWDQRMKGVTREQLEDALDKADVGGLCSIVRKHYEKASCH